MPINNTTNDLGANDMVQVYTIGSQGQLQPRYIKLTDLSSSINTLGAIGANSEYTSYVAILNQASTNAPTDTVLKNTLGGDISWSYTATGTYRATLSGAFTVDKVVIFFTGDTNDNADYLAAANISANYIDIFTRNGGVLADALLKKAAIEIRVYN